MKTELPIKNDGSPNPDGTSRPDPSAGSRQTRAATVKRVPQRLLILEDDPFYTELLDYVIIEAWPACQITVTTTEAAFRSALEQSEYDVILSDFSMPGFNGLRALAVAREKHPDIPFVIVSGRIEDEAGAESLRAGATDYVLKDRIARLVPAIQRALDEQDESKQRQRAESARADSEAITGAILNAALDCVIVTDDQGRIIEFNPAAEKTFGHPGNEVIGRSFVDTVFPVGVREAHRENLRRARAGCGEGTFNRRVETTGVHADGTEFPLEMAIVPIQLKSQLVFTAYLRDISERKHAEDGLKKVQSRLEKSNRDLMRRNQEIQGFYHTLSHELKTPLTSAREFVSIVMDGLAGAINPTQAEYLGIAKESCDQLQLCINDLLDATRLETGKLALEIKPVQLSALLQRIITAFRLKAGEKNIQLLEEVQPDMPAIMIDEHRITQVVNNLLSNAIRHTPAGGSIFARAGEVPGQPGWFQVSVSDTGCGIPEEEQEHIFDRLYQVKAGDAATGNGIGLGLYLCHELVQLHGGSIWVRSKPDKGSQFVFVLPKDREALRFHVLIMDDDPRVQELSRGVLGLDYNVRTVGDGASGLHEMEQQLPDVVVINPASPRVEGPETLKQIRERWGTSIPVIVYTTNTDADSELMKRMMEYSPFTLLTKPCSPAQVCETIGKVARSTDTTIWRRKQHVARFPKQ